MVQGHFYPEVRIECAELEPQIITLAEKFFGIRRSAHLHVTVEDARVLLAQSDNLYDLILVDVFLDNGYSPYRLATVEFYELCRMRLSAGGALAVNLLANDPFVDRKLESICSVFGSVWTLTTRPFDGDENIVALASDATDLDRRTLVQRAEHLATRLPFAYQAYASAMLQPDYLAVSPLRDAAPPDGYFDLLPPFTGAFSRVDPGLPCPCGSGLRYAACHGAPADTPPSQT
jgi:spermidine synthase